jgi:hypothetical protein
VPRIDINGISIAYELIGDGALYIDPHNMLDLRHALERVLSNPDLRHQLGERGCQRARQLTWTATAKDVIQLFAELT